MRFLLREGTACAFLFMQKFMDYPKMHTKRSRLLLLSLGDKRVESKWIPLVWMDGGITQMFIGSAITRSMMTLSDWNEATVDQDAA